jgi:hypothetical protein
MLSRRVCNPSTSLMAACSWSPKLAFEGALPWLA